MKGLVGVITAPHLIKPDLGMAWDHPCNNEICHYSNS